MLYVKALCNTKNILSLLGNSHVAEYNPDMSESGSSRNLPDLGRISILAATILLAYALVRIIKLPSIDIGSQLPGFYFAVQINVRTAVAVLVAGLTASGAAWLLHDHPELKNQSTLPHLLLPALTAWVIGLPLAQMPIDLLWWIAFGLGGGILMLVLVAEYIVVDPNDLLHAPATVVLTSISFALFLALVVTLRVAGVRLFLILPAVAIAMWLVSLRTLHLRLPERWCYLQAGIIALIIGQLAAALHYWPLPPVTYGLVLLGPAYALTSLIYSLMKNVPIRQAIYEPTGVLLILWGLAVWIR